MRLVGLMLLMLASPASLAQVYSWKDPETGTTKISNLAPPWYTVRAEVSGPRTVAIVGGKLIDDTALPYDKRIELLQSAQRSQGGAQGKQDKAGAQVAGAKALDSEKD